MRKCIMVVGAHADDVELHNGGTLFKYMDRGYEVVYVMATNNMSGGTRTLQPEGRLTSEAFDTVATMEYRKREAADAARLFNTAPIHLDHPQRHGKIPGDDGTLRQIEVRYGCPLPAGVAEDVPTILTAYSDEASVARLAERIGQHDPEAIFTHGFAETNPEHYGTFLLTVKAYGKAAEDGYHGALLHGVRNFRELGRMGCCWETWVDITGFVDRRMAAVQKHVSQYPSEFTHGADHWRAIAEEQGGVCGVGAAEIFNFVNTGTPDKPTGELLAELLAHRTDKQPWGL